MTISKLLRQAREKKGLSQRELAKMVGVSHVTICHYERDNHMPRISHLKRLAQALDLTLLEIVERI